MIREAALWLRTNRKVVITSLVIFTLQIAATYKIPLVLGEPFYIAKSLLYGQGFSYPYPGDYYPAPTCYIPPLYVFNIYALYLVAPALKAIQVMNLIYFQLAMIALYAFWRQFYSERLCYGMFLAVSLFVPLWVLAQSVEPNALNVLLLVLTISRLWKLQRAPQDTKHAVLLGVLVGLQMLVRPDMLLGALLFAVWFVLTVRDVSVAVRLRAVATSLIVASALVLPWTIRNYVVFDEFVLVSANAGYNFFIGNNPTASGEFQQNAPVPASHRDAAEIRQFAQGHSQIERDRDLLHRGESWALAHPTEVVQLSAKKFWYHWWRRGAMGGPLRDSGLLPLYDFAIGLMLVFGAIGFVSLNQRRLQTLFLTLFLYSTAISVIFFVQSRHRMLKVDPFLIPMAVLGVSVVAEKWRVGVRKEHPRLQPKNELTTSEANV